jgi:hypothetical protein
MQPRAVWSRRALSMIGRRVVYVAVAAVAIPIAGAVPASAARPVKGATYEYGPTEIISADTTSVSFRVSRRGRTLMDIFVNVPLPCSNGRKRLGLFFGQGQPAKLSVTRDGSFSGTFALGPKWLDAFAVSDEYWFSGTFTRRGKAAGLVIRGREVGEGGTVCDSGDRRVTARRAS